MRLLRRATQLRELRVFLFCIFLQTEKNSPLLSPHRSSDDAAMAVVAADAVSVTVRVEAEKASPQEPPRRSLRAAALAAALANGGRPEGNDDG